MKYGFIGLGNMASAIINGMHKNGFFESNTVYGHNRSPEKTDNLARETGLIPCTSNDEAALAADIVVLAVKPQMMEQVLSGLSDGAKRGRLFITIAAGKPLSWYEGFLPGAAVIRAMPNINAIVGLSSTAICGNANTSPEQLDIARKLFSAVGRVYDISEAMFSGFSALCGSSVAFTFMYMDAIACAGVKAGFPKKTALEFASQSVMGCAALLQETGLSPAEFVDRICSPGGTTIEGVHKIRELGFESAVYRGIDAIIEKDRAMGK